MYLFFAFLMNDTATTEIYTYSHTLSLHDALPISFGHGEAAENIHRSKDDGHKAEPFGRLTAGFGAGNQRPNDDDRRNRVRDRHQRCVQRRRYRPDHIIANATRQPENLQDGNKSHACFTPFVPPRHETWSPTAAPPHTANERPN